MTRTTAICRSLELVPTKDFVEEVNQYPPVSARRSLPRAAGLLDDPLQTQQFGHVERYAASPANREVSCSSSR